MTGKYKILILLVIILIVGIVGYYTYEEYNVSKTQIYLSASLQQKNTANDYLNQANAYENNNDYTNAIIMLQKSTDEISKALENDNNALSYSNGVYKDYLNNDILLLQTISKLIEYKAYLDHYYKNDLNPSQETVNPSTLNPYITNLENDISKYKDKENQIISANPDKFRFLKQ